jgi:hypothetical protein
VTDQLALLEAEAGVLSRAETLLGAITPAPPPAEGAREGRPPPPIAPEAWKRAIDFLVGERSRMRDRRRAIGQQARALNEQLEKIRVEIGQIDLSAATDRRIQAIALVESSGGRASLELEYFVPGASWRPAYDLRFHPDQNKVILETHGVVRQTSGEDWDQAELHLSTAIPGQGIDLPPILTWTLGEAKELIPVPRPRVVPKPPPPVAVPAIARSQLADEEAAAAALADRLAQLGQLASQPQRGPIGDSLDFANESIAGALLQPKAGEIGRGGSVGLGAGVGHSAGLGGRSAGAAGPMASVRPEPAPPPAPPAPGRSYQQSIDVAELSVRAEAADRDDDARSTRTALQALDLFEAPPARIELSDPTLPAVSAGGFDYVYAAKGRITVRSDGVQVRAPLGSESYPVETFYEASPGLSDTAYLKSTVTNRGSRPILTGPITIFVVNEFVGDATMKTTGPGGTIELPLGADENIKLTRRVVPTSDREGFFSKSDVTTYRVQIEVVSHKKVPVKLVLREPLPKSNNEDIEIEIVEAKPKPSRGPDDEGIVEWSLTVPPKKRQQIELVYKIERPADWQLFQR